MGITKKCKSTEEQKLNRGRFKYNSYYTIELLLFRTLNFERRYLK